MMEHTWNLVSVSLERRRARKSFYAHATKSQFWIQKSMLVMFVVYMYDINISKYNIAATRTIYISGS